MIVLLQFSATWCGPCKQMIPVVAAFAVHRPDVRVEYVDIDRNPLQTNQFGVRTVPTFVVIRDGKEIARHVGTIQLQGLKDLVAR